MCNVLQLCWDTDVCFVKKVVPFNSSAALFLLHILKVDEVVPEIATSFFWHRQLSLQHLEGHGSCCDFIIIFPRLWLPKESKLSVSALLFVIKLTWSRSVWPLTSAASYLQATSKQSGLGVYLDGTSKLYRDRNQILVFTAHIFPVAGGKLNHNLLSKVCLGNRVHLLNFFEAFICQPLEF